jgi:hypothetical protein
MPFTPTLGLLAETLRTSVPVPVVGSTVIELPVGLIASGFVGSPGDVKPLASL